MKTIHFILLISIVNLFSACEDADIRNIKDYYYPLQELEKGLIYEYKVVNKDSIGPDYWHYKSIPTDTANYLLKTYFQQDANPQQLIREEIVSNGTLLDQLRIFERDSTGENRVIKAKVLSPNAFPFEIEHINTVYLYKVRFQLPSQPYGHTTLIINRRFLGDTTYQYQDKTYPAIYFDTRGQVSVRDSINGDIEPRFWGEETYAKGLGLVSYRRSYDPNDHGLEYHLVDRYEEEEFFEGNDSKQ